MTATFWFRDDDACEITPQLERLQTLALQHGLEIALAVIPGKLQCDLIDRLRMEGSPFYAMCHGWKHVDYGPEGRPGEFGPDRELAELRADAKLAFDEFATHFGNREVVFVPPYGRITEGMTDSLAEIGFVGVSTGPTTGERRLAHVMSRVHWLPPVPLSRGRSIPHFDVQIDPFDWAHGTARLAASVGNEIVGHLRLRRRGLVASGSPVGFLMHHLVHDAATWDLYEEVLAALTNHSAVRFARVRSVIGLATS
jgi:peptidoglycan/xylan/chitin deacetylase (PgdA/CDA1 family)